MNFAFVAALALGLFLLLSWGVRALPAERWQMLAAVPVAKAADGSWRGVNLTFYGFFSATGTAFGFTMMLLLLASVGIPASIATDCRAGGAKAQYLYHRGCSFRHQPDLTLADPGASTTCCQSVAPRDRSSTDTRSSCNLVRPGGIDRQAGLPEFRLLLRHAAA